MMRVRCRLPFRRTLAALLVLLPLQAFSAALREHDPMLPGSELPAATRAELAPMHDAISDLRAQRDRAKAKKRGA